MLTRIEIEGFKTLLDVSIDPGAVNVFVGANGSGKSNILEALGLISAVASGRAEPEAFRYRGVRLGDPSAYLSSFRNVARDRLAIRVADDHVTYKIGLRPSEIRPSFWAIDEESLWLDGVETVQRASAHGDSTPEEQSDLETITELENFTESMSIGAVVAGLGLLRQNAIERMTPRQKRSKKYSWIYKFAEFDVFLPRLASYAIFNPTAPQLRGLLEDVHRDPVGLGGSGIDKAVEEILDVEKGSLGPFDLDDIYELVEWVDQIAIAPQPKRRKRLPNQLRFGDRFMEESQRFLSAMEASEGSLYVLMMLVLVGHGRSPKIFSVDNFDQSLHPRLASALTKIVTDQILNDDSRQVFLTTHNPLVLDGLDLLDDRVRLFTVDRDKSGASKIQRVQVTEELIEKGFSLSRLWTSGRLGGVPSLL